LRSPLFSDRKEFRMSITIPASLPIIPLTRNRRRNRINRESEVLTLQLSNRHQVWALFALFAVARAAGNTVLADHICKQILVRTEVEEILYPTALDAIEDTAGDIDC